MKSNQDKHREIYMGIIELAKTLEEKQLKEFYHDMLSHGAKIDDIERIADTAYHFVENYDEDEHEPTELGEYEEYLEVDNRRRAREGI